MNFFYIWKDFFFNFIILPRKIQIFGHLKIYKLSKWKTIVNNNVRKKTKKAVGINVKKNIFLECFRRLEEEEEEEVTNWSSIATLQTQNNIPFLFK